MLSGENDEFWLLIDVYVPLLAIGTSPRGRAHTNVVTRTVVKPINIIQRSGSTQAVRSTQTTSNRKYNSPL